MLLSRNFSLLLSISFVITGCIDPYMPKVSREVGETYIITGEVTNQEGYQYVTVAKPSPVDSPRFIPVTGCIIDIQDDKGNIFHCEPVEPGKYDVWMDKAYLTPGTSYKINILTPLGEKIESDFDKMPLGPKVDSVYYERKEIPTKKTDVFIKGLQFYVDLKAAGTDSHFYRWTIDETWRYESPYPLEYYYDGAIERVHPPDYSKKVCWSTKKVPGIYNLSTQFYEENGYKKNPLHFVDNTTNRLYYGYSILVNQYAISEPSYNYWEQLRINSEEQGGLYEHQPLPVEGNLQNITNNDHKVLGFFGASYLTQKRIYLDGIRDLDIYYDVYCRPYPLEIGGWKNYTPEDYPVYIVYIDLRMLIADKSCVDCTNLGGTTVKPDFWIW